MHGLEGEAALAPSDAGRGGPRRGARSERRSRSLRTAQATTLQVANLDSRGAGSGFATDTVADQPAEARRLSEAATALQDEPLRKWPTARQTN
eukprot:11645879-Alexandrium_andersonii.AAC.1